MSAPAKLALFALVLVVVFAVGAGIGALVDSGGPSSPPAHIGHAR